MPASATKNAMDEERWTAVDEFISRTLLPGDPLFAETLRAGEDAGLPPISVSAPLGMLLHVLVRALGARRVLEIGTLAGYSTIWIAHAVGPEGKVITLELDPHHAEVAGANFGRAGVTGVVELRLGPALESLERLEREGADPFDLIFIDADKTSYPDYLRWALRLSRVGTVLVVDNVVRAGSVLDADSDDPAVVGTRSVLELMGAEPRLAATVIQTVGSKGYDGFALALVNG